MKKILFTIYTHSLGGGAEKILTNVVNGLAERTDYEISILQYADYGIKQEPVNSKVTVLPPVVDMNRSSRLERIIKFVLVHVCPWVLRKRYATDRYDVEIAFNYQIPSFLTRKNVYNIQWNHGDVYDLQATPFKRFLQGRCYKKADKIVVISQNTKESVSALFSQYRDKIHTIYNGTDVPTIQAKAEQATDLKLGENAMVFLGRLEDNKDPMRLVQYTQRAIAEGADVRLYLLGHGEQADELAAYIHEAGLDDRIHLLGYVNEPYAVIKQGRAVCMLSKSEGFPTVFTEGMALGVPFISTPVGGTQELCNDGACGKIVNSYEEFKQAVDTVVLNAQVNKQMSENCLKHIQSFSYDKQISEVIQLIEQA